MDGTSAWWSIPRAVLAFPWGSRSMTRALSPDCASAAATLTVVVVLPTPPFWLATVRTRGEPPASGTGDRSAGCAGVRSRRAPSREACPARRSGWPLPGPPDRHGRPGDRRRGGLRPQRCPQPRSPSFPVQQRPFSGESSTALSTGAEATPWASRAPPCHPHGSGRPAGRSPGRRRTWRGPTPARRSRRPPDRRDRRPSRRRLHRRAQPRRMRASAPVGRRPRPPRTAGGRTRSGRAARREPLRPSPRCRGTRRPTIRRRRGRPA